MDSHDSAILPEGCREILGPRRRLFNICILADSSSRFARSRFRAGRRPRPAWPDRSPASSSMRRWARSGDCWASPAPPFDGQRLIVGVASNDYGGIYLASAASGIQRIAHAASPSAVDLSGSSLYFADNQAQQIWQVQSYAGTPAAVLFANDSGISSPAGLQVSADGQRLYAANAGSRTLSVYDITSRSPVQSLDLNFTP